MFDVARLAGVSHQTVSRVINDHPSVRDTTRQRVREAMQQLRYRPNLAARAMSNKASRGIGLITAGSADYGPSSTVQGLSGAARDARYSVTISTAVDAEPDTLRDAVELLLGQQVEAIVLVMMSRRAILTALQGVHFTVPVIAVESAGLSPTPSISIDQYAGAQHATEYLIGLGHRDILHLAGPVDSSDATERHDAWRATMSAHGLVAHPALQGDWSPNSGYDAVQQALQEARAFTAIFSANDQMALGCLHALRDAGIGVPQDVSVVGFDDIPEAEHFDPPLTTMRQDFRQLGKDIMALVLAQLTSDATYASAPKVPQLLVRGSTRSI